MSHEANYPSKSNLPGKSEYHITLVGGSSALDAAGTTRGLSFARSGTGAGTITMLDDVPGNFRQAYGNFRATTNTNVDTYSCVFGTYDADAKTITVLVSEAGTPTDLAALEWVDITLIFADEA